MRPDERQARFEELVNGHRKILYKVCRLYCTDAADHEDLSQEILVQLWRSFASFDGRCMFSTWMYRVALNTAISFARSESRRRRYLDSSEAAEFAAFESPAPVEESDQVRTMYQLISNLDPLPRALMLLYLDGNSYDEMAAILGISVTNVATKLNRLKEAMKRDAARVAPAQKGESLWK
jgi:RNA polymerase sigma-70 factor (ECF subfamily)